MTWIDHYEAEFDSAGYPIWQQYLSCSNWGFVAVPPRHERPSP
jgi:hypothetical protein